MMTRQECFKILRLENSAGPNAIKQSYRKLAFELHPDLHPELPDAAKRFQMLNEAYVLLMREYDNTSFNVRNAQTPDASNAKSEDPEKTRAEAHKAYQKHAEAESGNTAPRRGSREELLRDLLNDPFARHVFEDIYSHVRHNENKAAPIPAPPRKKKRKLVIKTGRPLWAAMGNKIGIWAGGVKSWLRSQIDDEQEMFLPGDSLFPGARVRLQVRHGFSDKSRIVEFALPPEFKPGVPIRLRGLGKHLGGLKGDLYLRVFEGQEEE